MGSLKMSNYNYSFNGKNLSVDYLEFQKKFVANIDAFCGICCYVAKNCDRNVICNCSQNGSQMFNVTNYDDTTIENPNGGSSSSVNYEMIQAAIIVASVIWFIILGAIVYRVCQRYRTLSNSLSTTVLSTADHNNDTSSIDRNIAESLRDRPPSYQQSYRHMMPEDAPPIYDDLVLNQREITMKENTLPSYEMAVGSAPFVTYSVVDVPRTESTVTVVEVTNNLSSDSSNDLNAPSLTADLHI